MKVFILYVALFLQLLVTMLPILPDYLTYVAMFFFIFYLVSEGGGHISKEYKRWMIVVFCFFSLSMVWALKWNVAAYKLVSGVIPIFVATTAVYSFLRKNPNNLRKLLWVYVVAATLFVIYILINIGDLRLMAEGERLGGVITENAGMEGDATSKFNSNMVGVNLCFLLLTGYVLFFKSTKRQIIRIAYLAAAVLIGYLVLLSGSRKAFFILIIPFVVLPLLNRKKGKVMLIIPISIGVIIMAYFAIMNIPILYSVMGTRVEDLFHVILGTTTGQEDISRLMLMEYGIEWFKERPILGYGINNFRVLSDNTSMFAGRNFYAHNNYLELLVGVGIVGFLIYYSCYYYFWKRLRKNVAGNSLNKWIVMLIAISLFLDIAQVSYYDFIRNMIICLCFYAAEMSSKTKIITINKSFKKQTL